MNFKIGDRVRCINATLEAPIKINTLKHNQEYIVHDIAYCRCGEVRLNVGAVAQDERGFFICDSCYIPVTKAGEVNEYFGSRRFVKVQEKYKAVKIQLEKKEPILS